MTAAAKSTPNCYTCKRVFKEGGATQAPAVATCAQVLMHLVGLDGVTALRSCMAHRLRWCSCLNNSVANGVGLLLGLMAVVMRSTLMGLTVGISVGTLRIGACRCMEHVIYLLSLVWGV
jgi:hypothetical protein